MFSDKTTLILGAGASVPYGYPTGNCLIEKIKEAINDDYLLYPTQKGNTTDKAVFQAAYDNNTQIELDNDVLSNFPSIISNKDKFIQGGFANLEMVHLPGVSVQKYLYAHEDTRIELVSIKLSQIKELKLLSDRLRQLNPISIDKFLLDYPSHRIAGKLMINYCLLSCEANPFGSGAPEKKRDDWYRLLFNDITSGCSTEESINNNKLQIITFNYDVSLDYYLNYSLKSIERFSNVEKNIESIAAIHHVYGKLHEINSSSVDAPQNNHIAYGVNDNIKKSVARSKLNGENTSAENMLRFFLSYSLALNDNIKVVGESKQGDANNSDLIIARSYLHRSQKVIIIGFGFDTDNQELLGMKRLFENAPKICLLNYEGKLEGLSREISHRAAYPNVECASGEHD